MNRQELIDALTSPNAVDYVARNDYESEMGKGTYDKLDEVEREYSRKEAHIYLEKLAKYIAKTLPKTRKTQ